MDKKLHCSSCKVRIANLAGSTKFLCPNCGKHEIVRCKKCREIVSRFKCPECKFEGPN